MAADGNRLIQRYQAAKSGFSSKAATLDVLAPFINPSRGKAGSSLTFEGEAWTTDVYDGTGIYASEMGALFFDGYATNPATKWTGYKDKNAELNKIDEVQEWYQECSERALGELRESNSYAALHEAHRDWWDWGCSSIIVEEQRQDKDRPRLGFRGLRCTVDRIGRFFLELDANHEPGAEFRDYQLNAWAAIERYGADKVSQRVKDAAQQQDYGKLFTFVHGVYPRTTAERDSGKGYRGRLPYSSCYVELESKMVALEDGYEVYPFCNPRQTGLYSEVYGRGRADLVANDVMSVNAAKRLGLEDHALKIRPPTFVDDDRLSGLQNLIPGSFIPVARRGTMALQDLFYQYQTNSRPDITNLKEEEIRAAIMRLYFVDTFKNALEQDLKNVNNFTYGKQIELAMKMVGPHYTGLQYGLHMPLMKNVFRIMYRAGAFSNPPDAVLQAGGAIEISFDSPLARAQKQDEVTALERYSAFLATEAEAEAKFAGAPAYDMVEHYKFRRHMAELYGVPANILTSEEDYLTIQGSKAEEMQKQKINTELAGGAQALGQVAPFLKVLQGGQAA